MSDTRFNIKEALAKIQELAGQRAQYKTLDKLVDELIDALNEFIDTTDDTGDKEKARLAIETLMNVKDDDVAKVKLAEDEARGKGATKNKERNYSRQLDSAIEAIASAVSYF